MGGAPASAPGPAASWALERPARLALRSLEAGVLGDASEIVVHSDLVFFATFTARQRATARAARRAAAAALAKDPVRRMWIFIGAGMAVLTALIDPDGSLTGFVTAIVFIASVYGLMAAPTLRSLLYAAGLAAIAALAFAAIVARFVPQLIALVQYFQRGHTRLLTAAELEAHAIELLAADDREYAEARRDLAAEAAADDGAVAGLEISWSTMEPGTPSLLNSCLMDHSTIGHDGRPVCLIDSDLSLSDLPLGRLGRVRERGIVDFSELPLGNRSGSAPVPKAGAGVREDEDAKRNVVHLR